MSGQENYELDIEINSRDIDETEKKLSRLDKMLQQTQKRFDALGKTRINPKITLDDRLTPAVTRIRDNLFRLDRTIVKPIASLIDHVSADVGVIRSSLASLTQTPWKISVVGPSWDTVIGQSFDDWMGTEGQSTLQRISSSLGNTLGDGLRGFIMKALGLVESPKIDESSNGILNGNQNIAEDQSIFGEAGRQAGERFFKSFLEEINSEEITNKITGVGSNSAGNGDKSCKDQDSEDSTTKDLMIGIAGGLITEWIINKFSKGKAPSVPVSGNSLGGIPPRFVTHGTSASWLSKAGIYGKIAALSIVAGITIGEMMNQGLDNVTMLREENTQRKLDNLSATFNPEETKDWAWVQNEQPEWYELKRKFWNWVANTEMFGVDMTDVFGQPEQKKLSNGVAYPITTATMDILNGSMEPGITPNMQPIYFNGKEIPQRSFTSEELRALNTGTASFGQLMSPNIYVTFPEGAVNMTVNKEENIDYEELVSLVGWHVANAVRYAEQNLK